MQHEYGIFGGKAGSHAPDAAARAAHADRDDAAHDPRRAEPASAPRDGRAHRALRAPRGHERTAAPTLLREVHGVAADEDRPHPARHPGRAVRRRARISSASTGRSVILTFGLLSPDKGIEHVIDALPAILAHYPDTVYIVLGATHPHINERHGETYRLMLEARAQAARRRRQHDLPQPLRQPGRARRVPRRRRHLHHALPQARADHLGHARLRGRRRQGGHLDAVLVRARAARRRPRHPRAVARSAGHRRARSSGCSTIAEKRLALRRRAAALRTRHALAGRRARLSCDSFERARAEHAQRLRTAFRAQTLATRPAELPAGQPRSRRSDDRRHRHPAARRRSTFRATTTATASTTTPARCC